MSSEMLEGVFVSSGEGGFCLPPPQQNTCMPLQVYAIDVDITETMGDLLARAGEALTLDLTHHRVTVLGERQLDIQDTLQDQCGTRTGRVQVQFVILPGMEKEEENRRGVLDIVDVLKSSEEEPSQEERIKEGVSLPTSPPEKSKPTRWIVSTEFREIQKALKMPRDPRKWSSSHVRVWLVWARQHFPEVGPYQNHHRDLDGAQMMSLTPSQLQQRHVLVTSTNNEPSTDLFLTHRDLLRQTGAAAVCEQPPAPPHSIQQQIAQVTSRSENVQRSTTATAANATGSQPIQLWQFLLELLTEPKLVKVISWWGSGVSGEFRLHQPEVVASLWGHRKGRPNMTYDKLSRALRYYYEGDMIAKVAGKRFVYRFVLDLKVVVGYSAAELKAQIEQCIQNG